MLLLLLAAVATAPPTAVDVQAFEVARVLGPNVDVDREGRAYVEFAPTVETRNANCTLLDEITYECRYEARVKEFFVGDFGPWETMRRRIRWLDGCWREVTPVEDEKLPVS